MSGWLIALIVIGAVIVVVSVLVAVVHERLTIRRSVFTNAFAFVEAKLNDRHSLAEELRELAPEEAAAGLAATLEQARAAAKTVSKAPQDGDEVASAFAAEGALVSAAKSAADAVGEKADSIREGLEEVEEHLTFATATFNWAVDAYNRSRRRFPGRGFARLFGFRIAARWPAPEGEVANGS